MNFEDAWSGTKGSVWVAVVIGLGVGVWGIVTGSLGAAVVGFLGAGIVLLVLRI